jgi:hypothetical protein
VSRERPGLGHRVEDPEELELEKSASAARISGTPCWSMR